MIAKRIAILAALVALPLTGVAHGAPFEGAAWLADAAPGSSILELRFGASAQDIEVREVPAGVVVRAPGTPPAASPPEDVEYVASDGHIEIHVRRPGSTIESVHVDGGTVRIRIVSGLVGGASRDYRLGIGDIVTISVYQDPDLSGEYPVGQDGKVNLPLIGAVQAEGATEGELLATVRARLGEFLVDPHVSVSISAYESQYVYVNIEEFGTSRKVAMTPGTSLTDVLAEAGVALKPGQEVTLSRREADGDGADVRMSAADLDRGQAPTLRAGDVLTVHPPDYVFVRGEVRVPARMTLTPGLTLQQAITMVQGLTEWASRKDIRILRQGPDGQTEISVNLKKVEAGKSPDPVLESGDLVIIRRRAF